MKQAGEGDKGLFIGIVLQADEEVQSEERSSIHVS